jgi:Lipase (class 3)
MPPELKLATPPPVFIAGHSLGAAEAVLYAYDRVERALPVDGIYVFGCPRPGNSVIGSALASVPVWRSIRNDLGRFPDYDLVTAVPFDIEECLDYAQPAPFEAIAEAAAPDDPWFLFRYHHSQLYQAGCRKLPPTGGAVELTDAIDAVQDLYDNTGRWDVPNFVDGQYWGMRVMPNGARLLVFRGSATGTDWSHDLDTMQILIHAAKVSRGFWASIGLSRAALDAALA